jgi:chemotaxis protein MotB
MKPLATKSASKAESHDYEHLPNHMGHGGGGHHEEEEGEGPWLMSFADMVTLLMCFFILFFSVDKGKGSIDNPEKLLEKLQTLIGLELASLSPAPKPEEMSPSESSRVSGEAVEVEKELKRIASDLRIVFSIGHPEPGVLELVFLNANFFSSGSAELTPVAMRMIDAVVPKLRGLAPESTIEVNGHTDSSPISNRIFLSNWELSAARASAVVRRLESAGIDPRRLRASGFAATRPVVPEYDARGIAIPSNRALNRRIVIQVKTNLAKVLKKEAPL